MGGAHPGDPGQGARHRRGALHERSHQPHKGHRFHDQRGVRNTGGVSGGGHAHHPPPVCRGPRFQVQLLLGGRSLRVRLLLHQLKGGHSRPEKDGREERVSHILCCGPCIVHAPRGPQGRGCLLLRLRERVQGGVDDKDDLYAIAKDATFELLGRGKRVPG